jgi:hypothetical protein
MKIIAGKSKIHALGKLKEELLIANDELHNSDGDDLLAMTHAVNATIVYLHCFEDSLKEGLTDPLIKLNAGLCDLLSGHPPKALQKPKSSRGSGMEASSDVGYAVAAAELLKGTGMKYEEAFSLVARTCQSTGMENQGHNLKGITSTTIENWRKKISADIAINTTATKSYQNALDNFPDDGLATEARRDAVIAWLKNILSW